MVVMMFFLVADILFRTFGYPLHGMAEMSVFVMMIVIYLGFSRCEEYSEHVSLEFLVKRLPFGTRKVLFLFRQILAVCTVGALFYAVTSDAFSALQTGSSIAGTVDLPIWPTKFIMVIGLAFFLVQTVINLTKTPSDNDPDLFTGEHAE